MKLVNFKHTKVEWSQHALDRRKERKINIEPGNIKIEEVLKLPYYINNECYHYCDSKEGVTYYIRYCNSVPIVVTIIKRNPISMARKICDIKGWDFDCICRDHLFGNCNRHKCRFEHKTL